MAQQQKLNMVGSGGGGGGPAPFLIKTHQMVEDVETDEVISWSEQGSSFVVWKPVEFARDLLPKHFKHNNFSSFVRQLNTYGFRKVVPDRWEFTNDYFRRGEAVLLSEIHRRKTTAPARRAAAISNSKEDDHQSSASASTSSPSLPPPPQHKKQLSELSDENEKLKKDNQILTSELAQTRRQCEELLGFLSMYVDLNKLDSAKNIGMMTKKKNPSLLGSGPEEAEQKEGGCDEDCLKLFGVRMKKREACEEGGNGGGRPMKKQVMGFRAPWMEMIQQTNRV